MAPGDQRPPAPAPDPASRLVSDPSSDPTPDPTSDVARPAGSAGGTFPQLPTRDADDLHVPVLLDRIVDLLTPSLSRDGAVMVDGTLGMGGHTLALLARFPALRVIGIDRDPQALAVARSRLEAAGVADRADLVHAPNDRIGEILDRRAPAGVQGILFDLGVSSLQLDETDRGFAYAVDAPLDMRMDPTTGPTAADVVNTYPPGALVRVLREFGEEKFATRIVSSIVRERDCEPFTTSARLVALIREAIPAAARRTGGHPAKRSFQALRVEVNDELGVLERALPEALRLLAVGGRIVVMSFQSLEDRIAKRILQPLTESTAPPGLPVVPEEYQPQLRWIVRGSVKPDDAEIAQNSRAASARLRVAERIREAA
ncbi:16S rRNA (cytosine(1402)-N(4))-methyltransferase RsmH [Nakamurella sp. YIM 132087]|uniref:Ribosomal RNA small subunit methyltransferase H n=1 Tax=Nakamurella alba TaxID=2665158 RepID=A0A7K1FQU3_9ACTN|nr:16S rRNA (cytosine(1402)-N(4))-methyltransferase RsmH [Nakamurella alba]MTD16518.1 16S rRNA (cytosine(1402)-N(4))-methyltransferase RsmH [Nakamurella alba]